MGSPASAVSPWRTFTHLERQLGTSLWAPTMTVLLPPFPSTCPSPFLTLCTALYTYVITHSIYVARKNSIQTCNCMRVSFPGPRHLQSLIACSLQIGREKAWKILVACRQRVVHMGGQYPTKNLEAPSLYGQSEGWSAEHSLGSINISSFTTLEMG